MVDFNALKKRKGSNLAHLSKAVEALGSKDRADDSAEFWKCDVDCIGHVIETAITSTGERYCRFQC